eukprot:scaffold211631_cov26-Tisochrysis_lutea.AAC.6
MARLQWSILSCPTLPLDSLRLPPYWTGRTRANLEWLELEVADRRTSKVDVDGRGLDAWFCRTGLGRGAIVTTIPAKTLTRSSHARQHGDPAQVVCLLFGTAGATALPFPALAASLPLWRRRRRRGSVSGEDVTDP